jgi:uncharacterized membrane protein
MIAAILALHLMAIALGAGFSTSNAINLHLARTSPSELGKGLALQRRMIARLGDGVIAVFWLTGLLLLWLGAPAWNAWLVAKLVVVLLLTLLHALARRTAGEIARTGRADLLGRLQLMSTGVAVCALSAIALAVAAFR